MAKLNAVWHDTHRMPRNPTMEQRVRWHVGHAKACGCRDIPKSILAELQRRGVALPDRRSGRF